MPWEPQFDKEYHAQMIEMILLTPAITNKEIAEALQLCELTVSLVRRSDMFQLKFRQRMAELQANTDEVVKSRLEGKLARVADAALDNLGLAIENEQKLLEAGASPNTRETRETAEMVLAALGYSRKGAPPAGPAQVVNNTYVVDASALANARKMMRSLGNGPSDGQVGQQVLPALPSPAEL